jgi:hypothetical protein
MVKWWAVPTLLLLVALMRVGFHKFNPTYGGERSRYKQERSHYLLIWKFQSFKKVDILAVQIIISGL